MAIPIRITAKIRGLLTIGQFRRIQMNNESQLLHLFPSTVMLIDMAGHPCKEKTLEIIDESVTNDHHLLSNGKSNFDTQRGFLFHPELKELCNDIQHHIHKFSTLLGTFPIHLANSWFNIMSPNGVVHPHRHEGSVVSGAYYIRAPEGSSSLHFSSPLKPLRMNEITQHVNPLNLAEKSMPIKEDLMILFPSWLEHFTNENDNTKRTVISFNTEYLKRDSRI